MNIILTNENLGKDLIQLMSACDSSFNFLNNEPELYSVEDVMQK
jgi:hypothetical protein